MELTEDINADEWMYKRKNIPSILCKRSMLNENLYETL